MHSELALESTLRDEFRNMRGSKSRRDKKGEQYEMSTRKTRVTKSRGMCLSQRVHAPCNVREALRGGRRVRVTARKKLKGARTEEPREANGVLVL